MSSSIDEALKESEYLIILCSKRTKESIWCTREVYEFRKHQPDDHIIPVLIEGEPYEVYNEAMQDLKVQSLDQDGNLVEKDLELQVADLRPDEVKNPDFIGYRDLEKNSSPDLARLKRDSIKILKTSEIYRIMAAILNVAYGDLKQRQKERRLKRILATSTAVGTALLIFAVSMTNMYFKSVASEKKAIQQTSMLTLKSADQRVGEGDRTLGLLVAHEAMKDIKEDMTDYKKLEANYIRILNDALVSPDYSTIHKIDLSTSSLYYGLSQSLGYVLVPGDLNQLRVYKVSNGDLVQEIHMPSSVSAITMGRDDKIAYIACRDGATYEINLEDYEPRKIYQSDTGFASQLKMEEDKYLFIVETTSTVKVFDLEKEDQVHMVSFDSDIYLRSMYMISDDKYVMMDSKNKIGIYDLSGKEIKLLRPASTEATPNLSYTGISPNRDFFAYTDKDQEGHELIKLYSFDTGKTLEITDSVSYISHIDISDDGKVLYGLDGAGDTNVLAWDTQTGSFISSYAYRMDPESFAINKDQSKMAMASKDKHEIIILEDLDKDSFDRIQTLSPGSQSLDQVSKLEFIMDDQYVLALSVDGTLRVIKANNPLEENKIRGKLSAFPETLTSFLSLIMIPRI